VGALFGVAQKNKIQHDRDGLFCFFRSIMLSFFCLLLLQASRRILPATAMMDERSSGIDFSSVSSGGPKKAQFYGCNLNFKAFSVRS